MAATQARVPTPRACRLRQALLASAALTFLALAAVPVRAQGTDSLRFRLEAGGSADFTNERFYETFDDSSFRRTTIDTPERRYAGVVLTGFDAARNGGTTWLQLVNELSIGNKLAREQLGFLWRSDLTPEDRLAFDPRFEYRRDRTLDRDLEEWRGSAGLRYRRSFLESFRSIDLALRGETVRSSGTGSEFVLDRDAGSFGIALEQAGLTGPEWRAGYRFTMRVFPDSTVRDHFEHGWEGRLHSDPSASWSWEIESSGERRVTIDLAPTSRDNFWEERAELEIERRGDGLWGFRGRLDGEGLQYDLQDSTLYFNYQTVRLTAGPRLGGLVSWSAWIAPRVEVLRSRWNPGEEYVEPAVAFELEALGTRAWWSVTPAVGWRRYVDDPVAEAQGLSSIHSSYTFFELAAFGDQPIGGGVRLRALANARLEAHDDDAQDGSSLYFSLDLRKIF